MAVMMSEKAIGDLPVSGLPSATKKKALQKPTKARRAQTLSMCVHVRILAQTERSINDYL